jgi:XTP/dITP diphosphohydrolase
MCHVIKLCVATNNRGKQAEFRELLADWPGELAFPQDLGLRLDVDEVGDSFAEIAALKARAYMSASGLPCLADDSGLEVDALGGAPGIYTARYAGPGASNAERWQKLLDALDETPEAQRTARFRCAVALALPGCEQVETADGTCEGRIAFAPRGTGGFGYDPIFYVPEYGCTMAELPAAIKNRISHRARALQAARPLLAALLAP